MNDLASLILASSQNLGVDPIDLATAISYETGGTFDPWKTGPTTKWGRHEGLIQMGGPQRQRYGYTRGAPLEDLVSGVERYLVDTGVQPGMGLLDIYSAINAGGVGRYNRHETEPGGMPGSVRDKVETQMGGHRTNAEKLLAGLIEGRQSPAVPPEAMPAPQMPAGKNQPLAALFSALPATAPPITQRAPRRDDGAAAEQERRRALFSEPVASLYG